MQPPDPAPGTGLYPADLDAQDHHQIQIQIYHPPPLHQSKPGNKVNIIDNNNKYTYFTIRSGLVNVINTYLMLKSLVM